VKADVKRRRAPGAGRHKGARTPTWKRQLRLVDDPDRFAARAAAIFASDWFWIDGRRMTRDEAAHLVMRDWYIIRGGRIFAQEPDLDRVLDILHRHREWIRDE
jgi:hypothetical protein